MADWRGRKERFGKIKAIEPIDLLYEGSVEHARRWIGAPSIYRTMSLCDCVHESTRIHAPTASVTASDTLRRSEAQRTRRSFASPGGR